MGKYDKTSKINNHKSIKIWIGLLITTSLMILGLSLLSSSYPISNTKDWIDIVSGVAQICNVATLVGLVYQIYVNNRDKHEEETPRLNIDNFEIVSKCNAERVLAFRLDEKPQSCESTGDDYKEMFRCLVTNDDNPLFLQMRISNHSKNYVAGARCIKLRVHFTYFDEQDNTSDDNFDFSFPVGERDESQLGAGSSENFYIRVGRVVDSNKLKIKMDVLEISCQNINGRLFTSKEIKFVPRSSHTKPLVAIEQEG